MDPPLPLGTPLRTSIIRGDTPETTSYYLNHTDAGCKGGGFKEVSLHKCVHERLLCMSICFACEGFSLQKLRYIFEQQQQLQRPELRRGSSVTAAVQWKAATVAAVAEKGASGGRPLPSQMRWRKLSCAGPSTSRHRTCLQYSTTHAAAAGSRTFSPRPGETTSRMP